MAHGRPPNSRLIGAHRDLTYQLYWPAALIDNFQSAATRRMPVESASEWTAKIAAALGTEWEELWVLAQLPRVALRAPLDRSVEVLPRAAWPY